MPVEQQVAIIFVATQGILDHIPTSAVRKFETELLERLTLKHEEALRQIRETGQLSDEVAELIKKEATDLADVYKNA